MKRELFAKNWFVSLVSLFFAILLFISVSNESNAFNSVVQNNNSASLESTVTISNVPVHLGEHDEGTFVSGMPETVSVRLTGPKNIISQLSVENFKVVTESLKGVQTGIKTIRFTVEGLPEKVEYKVTPDLFYGTISIKETVTKEIEYEVDEAVVAQGYQLMGVALSASEVVLSGSKEEIDKINRVLVTIQTAQPQTATFEEYYRIQILDADGMPLDINASPEEVSATVNIAIKEIQKPLMIVPIGEQNFYKYQYTWVDQSEVVVSGDRANEIESVNLLVDVSQLMKSGVITGTIQGIEGITITPQKINVQVTMIPINQETNTNESTMEVTTVIEDTTQTSETAEGE